MIIRAPLAFVTAILLTEPLQAATPLAAEPEEVMWLRLLLIASATLFGILLVWFGRGGDRAKLPAPWRDDADAGAPGRTDPASFWGPDAFYRLLPAPLQEDGRLAVARLLLHKERSAEAVRHSVQQFVGQNRLPHGLSQLFAALGVAPAVRAAQTVTRLDAAEQSLVALHTLLATLDLRDGGCMLANPVDRSVLAAIPDGKLLEAIRSALGLRLAACLLVVLPPLRSQALFANLDDRMQERLSRILNEDGGNFTVATVQGVVDHFRETLRASDVPIWAESLTRSVDGLLGARSSGGPRRIFGKIIDPA